MLGCRESAKRRHPLVPLAGKWLPPPYCCGEAWILYIDVHQTPSAKRRPEALLIARGRKVTSRLLWRAQGWCYSGFPCQVHELVESIRAFFDDLMSEVLRARCDIQLAKALIEFLLHFGQELVSALSQTSYQGNSHGFSQAG